MVQVGSSADNKTFLSCRQIQADLQKFVVSEARVFITGFYLQRYVLIAIFHIDCFEEITFEPSPRQVGEDSGSPWMTAASDVQISKCSSHQIARQESGVPAFDVDREAF